jgi:NADH:ubiquinone oxidoreductase subunit B-like Fe-S oxidoreductase
MLMVMGTISKKMAYLRQVYEQMSEPNGLLQLELVSSGGILIPTVFKELTKLSLMFTFLSPPRPEQMLTEDEITRTVRTESKEEEVLEYQELLALYISNKMALENTAIQDKLGSVWFKFINSSKKEIFFV